MDIDPRVQARLEELQDGYQATQLLYVAARLGVADALAERARSGDALAKELGADPGFLRRVLRGLAALGVLEERDDGLFGLSPVGELLRTGSLGGPILTRGAIYYRALDHLLDGVRTGTTPFDLAYGSSFFEYLAAHPAERAAFHTSMTERSVHEAKAVVAAYDFGRFRRLVDVGGGQGVLLSAIMAATPGLTGVLFDQPDVVEGAVVPAGCEVIGGDFFGGVPAGADAYVLSRILHNWNDQDALRILGNCRAAMPDNATLLIVDTVLPERAADQPAVVRMDISMLMLFPGRERTETEHAALLTAAGLTLEATIPTNSPAGVRILQSRPG